MIFGEPVAEIENDSREEAGFCEPEQKSEDTEADRAPDESHRNRDQAPGDHDATDPEARPYLVQDDGGGDFEQEVAEEEDARAKAEHLRCQANFLIHGQGGEANIDAIEKGNEVQEHEERNEPPSYLSNRALFEKIEGGRCDVAHTLPLRVGLTLLHWLSFLIVFADLRFE